MRKQILAIDDKKIITNLGYLGKRRLHEYER